MSTFNIQNFVGQWVKKGSSARVPTEGSISFSARASEWIFVAGKNGSGKSTFFEALCGFADRVAGNIHLDSCSLDLRDPHSRFLKQIQYVPQKEFFKECLAWKDAIEIVRLHREGLYNIEAISSLRMQLLEADWINESTPIDKRIFDLIIAVLSVPRVLILDEIIPCLQRPGRDAKAIYTFLKKLVPMATVLFAEHDLNIGIELADHVLWLREGHQPRFFVSEDLGARKELLAEVSKTEVDTSTCIDSGEKDWRRVLRPGWSINEHLALARRFCNKKYFAARSVPFRDVQELEERLYSDFEFLAAKTKRAEHLSGGQQVILAWFLLDFIGLGSIPISVFQHLDYSNRCKIESFWSKITVKDAVGD